MVKKSLPGFSTLEILIAFAILTLSLTAVISVFFGNQSVSLDTQTNAEALAKATTALEKERALAQSSYLSATSTSETEVSGTLTFTKTLSVADLTPCKKIATSTITWDTATLRPQKIELTTFFTDIAGTLALGGDCFIGGPSSAWDNPQRFASDTFSPGKPLALDVLKRVAYVASDKSPFLKIAQTIGATLGQTSGLFVSYTNSFDLGVQANDLDAIQYTNPSTGAKKIYVFLAINSSTNQLKVVDATIPTAPVVVATVSLSSCVGGSFPQGWFVRVYGNRLYLTTRETAGPELHIFDITTPSSPAELSVGSSACKGYELTDTVEQMSVREQVVGGTTKRLLYLATDENNRELRVLDVTNSLAITEQVDLDLAGTTDAASLYLVGNKLYFGRLSGAGADLFIYDVSNPVGTLPLLGSKDIGADVLGIRVAGSYAFIATGKTNQEFQVWNVSNPASITSTTIYNFGNVVGSGIDYEPDFIYATGQSTPNFQILYSP